MIPQVQDDLRHGFTLDTLPSYTLGLRTGSERVLGRVDGLEAMKQAIYLILSVERYDYLIHSWNYGVELQDLYGMPTSYCIPEIERRIREALLQDDRITAVDGFSFSVERGKIHTTFTVATNYGAVEAERTVETGV